jgi:hypothetical protein
VVIPRGVTVAFDVTGIIAPADASSAVHIDSLRGSGGNLSQSSGTLNVGTGGIVLSTLAQSGGTLTNAGATTLDSFSQTGGTTMLAQDLIVTQDFNQSGSGNLSVGGNTRITDILGGVQLGNLTTTGTLSVNSTDGAIVQAAGSAITAQSTSSFSATRGGLPADITLANGGNHFRDLVSLNGNNVALSDASTLTLGVVTTTGDLSIQSNGALTLGTSSVGGNLNASSGNGNITQTGKLIVNKTTTLNAGTGTVVLTAPGNSLLKGVTVSASSSNIAGDLVAAGNSAAATAVAGLGAVPTAGGGAFSAQTALAPLAFSTAQGSLAGVLVKLLNRTEGQSADWVAVSIPKNTVASGTGFTFALPTSVTEDVPVQATVRATMPDGSPLPDWLQFNTQQMEFTTSALPLGALPMRVLVTLGTKEVMVTISERNE